MNNEIFLWLNISLFYGEFILICRLCTTLCSVLASVMFHHHWLCKREMMQNKVCINHVCTMTIAVDLYDSYRKVIFKSSNIGRITKKQIIEVPVSIGTILTQPTEGK